MKSSFKGIGMWAIALLSVTVTLNATTFERVLVPIWVSAAAGDRGSIWQSSAWIFNGYPITRAYEANQVCFAQCEAHELRPGPNGLGAPPAQPPENPGVVVYVESPTDQINFELRVQDTTRAGETWGTEIRTVRESEALTGPARLLGVPIEPQFRTMLRIYDFDGRPNAVVRLRAFGLINNETLASVDLTLEPPVGNINTPAKFKPGYAQLPLAALPGLGNNPRIGIEVIPLTSGLRYWTFLSITHNDTQHVTTISPR